jgi:hypothetical protein
MKQRHQLHLLETIQAILRGIISSITHNNSTSLRLQSKDLKHRRAKSEATLLKEIVNSNSRTKNLSSHKKLNNIAILRILLLLLSKGLSLSEIARKILQFLSITVQSAQKKAEERNKEVILLHPHNREMELLKYKANNHNSQRHLNRNQERNLPFQIS